jgi:chromosome segregation ATPase
MRQSFVWVFMCNIIAVSGCTVAKLQQESGAMETRIAQKGQDLDDLESRRTALLAERTRLLTEIDNKQVTLNDLSSGLERLRQENARLRSDNELQQSEKRRLEAEIQRFQTEISRLDGNDQISEKVKKERIESLKKQIKSYLEIMLRQ